MIDIILLIVVGQMMIAGIFNVVNSIRIPTSFKDFLLLIFLPYVIIKRKNIKD